MDRSKGVVKLFSLLVIGLIPVVLSTDSNSIDSDQNSVKWAVSEFGQCSVACGGGIQVRTARCLRSSQRSGRIQETEVPEILCPLPSPQVTQSCNSHACKAHWTEGDWSECSVSCGVGTQSREVSCQVMPRQGGRFHVSHAECGGLAPDSTRKCHIEDCPFSDKVDPHSILSENYTLIQLYRTKKIKVNIGGQVYLLPGQTVVVKCPVKHYSKKLIYWSKGYKLVRFMGRVRITSGGLLISKGEPTTDGGIYTCIAGDQTATITVTFIEKDDPSTQMYKKWINKSKRQHKNDPMKHKNDAYRNNEKWITATNIGSDELSQQRDQSHNSSQSLVYVTSDWSTCSATCGASGHRKRKVSCSHVTPKYVIIVADTECHRAGLDKPEAIEECSAEKICAVWRTGPWSKCLPACGISGQTSRLLTCVWEATGQPAGTACDLKTKPSVFMPCKTMPCPLECIDSSRYCSLASLLKLCRFYHFQHQCCLTCQTLSRADHELIT